MEKRKLYKSQTDKMVAGVCGGLAEYLGIEAVLVRILFVILSLGGGSGVIIYIILAVLIPKEPESGEIVDEGEKKEEEKTAAGEGEERNRIGWIILAVGVVWLLNKLIPGWLRWDLVWPMAIILTGVYLLVRK